jgi:hypothetical protein
MPFCGQSIPRLGYLAIFGKLIFLIFGFYCSPDHGTHPLGKSENKRNQDCFLHRRHPDSGFDLHYLSPKHHGSPSPPDQSRLHHPLGEVQPHLIDRLPNPRLSVEHGPGIDCNYPSQDRHPPFSSLDPLQLDIPHLSPNPSADRPHCSLLQGSSAFSPHGKVAANKSKLSLLFADGSLEDSDPQAPGKERPQLDHQSHPTPVLLPLVESVSRSLGPRGPDGRIQNRLRHMVPRVPSPRPLGQHNHSSSYQCFGEYCFVDLPGLHPPPVVESTQHPLEDRQHHSFGLRQEGGTCSPRVQEIADKILIKAHQMSVRILPVFIPTGENILADAASRFQEIPDWQLHPSVFWAISARWGPPSIDLFVSPASKQTHRFFSWDVADNPEAVDALSQKWDITLAYAFPPDSSHQEW